MMGKVKTSDEAHAKPHLGLLMAIAAEPREVMIGVLVEPKDISKRGKNDKFEARSWDECKRGADKLVENAKHIGACPTSWSSNEAGDATKKTKQKYPRGMLCGSQQASYN